ncbi:MAG TPA: DUF1684 domain-containing protein [Casimicrobiaceae bacterium]|nr:DUF1684 domain-containing protein [Casimicrobiaceae bacterium]
MLDAVDASEYAGCVPRRIPFVPVIASLLLCVGAATSSVAATPPDAIDEALWREDLTAWRGRADAGLRRDRGWLSIIGRWELEPGVTRLGSSPKNRIVLPKALAPAELGTLTVRDGKATLELAPGQTMRVVEKNQPGKEFTRRELASEGERIEWVTGGRLSLQVVKRSDGRFVLRAADRDAPMLKTFAGRVWYEPRSDHRVTARFVPQPKGTQIPIANVRGEISYEDVAGSLEFTLNGQPVRLDALDDEGNLFVIFRDATSGQGSYPPGRFLSIRKPQDGVWTVDFNKAYNPPCAFSAYTTCPLPPPQNWMTLPVPAGERYVEKR